MVSFKGNDDTWKDMGRAISHKRIRISGKTIHIINTTDGEIAINSNDMKIIRR